MLYGHLVSTVEQLEDLQGNMGLFFLFPDVSIRTRGRYQLRVSLMRITRFEISLQLGFHAEPLTLTLVQTPLVCYRNMGRFLHRLGHGHLMQFQGVNMLQHVCHYHFVLLDLGMTDAMPFDAT